MGDFLKDSWYTFVSYFVNQLNFLYDIGIAYSYHASHEINIQSEYQV